MLSCRLTACVAGRSNLSQRFDFFDAGVATSGPFETNTARFCRKRRDPAGGKQLKWKDDSNCAGG